ncbi:MAG: metallophosphoesterase, partial [Candidatus Poribacteria bacterium]
MPATIHLAYLAVIRGGKLIGVDLGALKDAGVAPNDLGMIVISNQLIIYSPEQAYRKLVPESVDGIYAAIALWNNKLYRDFIHGISPRTEEFSVSSNGEIYVPRKIMNALGIYSRAKKSSKVSVQVSIPDYGSSPVGAVVGVWGSSGYLRQASSNLDRRLLESVLMILKSSSILASLPFILVSSFFITETLIFNMAMSSQFLATIPIVLSNLSFNTIWPSPITLISPYIFSSIAPNSLSLLNSLLFILASVITGIITLGGYPVKAKISAASSPVGAVVAARMEQRASSPTVSSDLARMGKLLDTLGGLLDEIREHRLPKILWVTDIHTQFSRLARIVKRESPDKVILGGDYFSRGLKNMAAFYSLKELKAAMQENCIPVWGNHEIYFAAAMLSNSALDFENNVLAGLGIPLLAEMLGLFPEALLKEMIYGDTKKLFEKAMSIQEAREMVDWLLRNLRVYHIERGICLTHSGLPVDENGALAVNYKDLKGMDALDAMQGDLQNARFGDGRNYTALFNVLFKFATDKYGQSQHWKGFYGQYNSEGANRLEETLDRLGVFAVFYGHTPVGEDTCSIERIMGLDGSMAEGKGRYIVLDNNGIKLFVLNRDLTVFEEKIKPAGELEKNLVVKIKHLTRYMKKMIDSRAGDILERRGKASSSSSPVGAVVNARGGVSFPARNEIASSPAQTIAPRNDTASSPVTQKNTL